HVGEVEARGNQRGIQIDRLAQFAGGLAYQVGGSFRAIRETQQHVGLGRARVRRQNRLELGDVCIDVISAREDVRGDARQTRIDRLAGLVFPLPRGETDINRYAAESRDQRGHETAYDARTSERHGWDAVYHSATCVPRIPWLLPAVELFRSDLERRVRGRH